MIRFLAQKIDTFSGAISHMNAYLMLITRSGTFNYDAKYRGATAKSLSCLQQDKELAQEGFALNHARVLVGSGLEAYEKSKSALQSWRFANLILYLHINIECITFIIS